MRKIDVVRLLIDEKIKLMSKVIQDIKSREIIVQELWHLRFMLNELDRKNTVDNSDCENVDNFKADDEEVNYKPIGGYCVKVDNHINEDKIIDLSKIQLP